MSSRETGQINVTDTTANPFVIDRATNALTIAVTDQGTAARTLTIPDLGSADGAAVVTNTAQTLTNKTLTADNTLIQASTGTARQVDFDITGATDSTKTTLDFNQTANRTITFPDASGTVAVTSTTTANSTAQTTDATVTPVVTIATSSDNVYLIDGMVTARRSDAGNETAETGGWFLKAFFKNDGGTVTQIGADDLTIFDDNGSAWVVDTNISTTNIQIRVTGEGSKDIEWSVDVNYREFATA